MEVELAIGLGIFVGLLFYEFMGLTAGGIVAPGYVALFLDQPVRLAGTLIVSLCTYFLIKWGSKYFIMFGRRRFAVIMLTSFLLRWLWEVMLIKAPISLPELRVIGYIVPGIIANEMIRQGILPTVCTLIIAATLVRLALLTLEGWNLLP